MSTTGDIVGLATGVIIAGAVVGALDRVGRRRSYPKRRVSKKGRRVYEYDMLGRRI